MSEENIILFKLISGEEIIGTVIETTPSQYKLKDTVTITYHPAENGKMSAGFAPNMPYSEGELDLYKHSIALSGSVKSDMLNEYKRIFGGIITARPKIVV